MDQIVDLVNILVEHVVVTDDGTTLLLHVIIGARLAFRPNKRNILRQIDTLELVRCVLF